MADQRVYRLQPLDASGVFLGLGVVQAGLLGGGILVAVAAISAGLPVGVAALPMLAAAVVSFARVGGHAAWEWLPLGSHWMWTGLTRGRQWAPPLPLWTVEGTDGPTPLPPCLAGLEVIEVPWRAGVKLGAVHDVHQRTLTAVVPVRSAQFVLEASAEQERVVAGWGDQLSQFATQGGGVAHVAWSDLVRPSARPQRPGTLGGGARDLAVAPAQAGYAELLEMSAPAAATHEVVVSITVTAERLRRHGGRDRIGEALVTAVDAVLRGFGSAGLEPGAPLGAAGLWQLLRVRVNPTRGVPIGAGWASGSASRLPPPRRP